MSKIKEIKLFLTGILWAVAYYLLTNLYIKLGGKILSSGEGKGYIFEYEGYSCGTIRYTSMFQFNQCGYTMYLAVKRILSIKKQLKQEKQDETKSNN